MSQLKNVCKKYGVEHNSPEVLELKELLGNKMGYFSVFGRWLFDESDFLSTTTIEELRELLILLTEIKISKAITTFQYSEELYDFLLETKNRRKLNQIVKSIPSHSRRNISERIKEVMFVNIDKVELFKDFFSKKGGSIKTEEELYQKSLDVIRDSEASHEYKDVLEKVENIIEKYGRGGSDIIYKNGIVIIARIDSFSVGKNLGSKHWCIVNQETYWNSYTRDDRTQYFIWQTDLDPGDKKSLIGVTIDSFANKIHAAHLKDDRSCDHKELRQFRRHLIGTNKPIDDVALLIRHDIPDISMFYKTTNWRTAISSSNGDSEKYLGNLSYSVYEDNIGNNNRVLDLGTIVNPVNDYNYNYSEIRTRGVSTHSKWDMDNDYFNELLKYKNHRDRSFYTLCSLIDEDEIEDVELRDKIIKGKVAFIINMGVLSGLVNNSSKQDQLNDMKKKIRYSGFGHREDVGKNEKENEKHFQKLKKELTYAKTEEKDKFRKVISHIDTYFKEKSRNSRLRIEWVSASESEKMTMIRKIK